MENQKKCKCNFCETELTDVCGGAPFCISCGIEFAKCDKCGIMFDKKFDKCPQCFLQKNIK